MALRETLKNQNTIDKAKRDYIVEDRSRKRNQTEYERSQRAFEKEMITHGGKEWEEDTFGSKYQAWRKRKTQEKTGRLEKKYEDYQRRQQLKQMKGEMSLINKLGLKRQPRTNVNSQLRMPKERTPIGDLHNRVNGLSKSFNNLDKSFKFKDIESIDSNFDKLDRYMDSSFDNFGTYAHKKIKKKRRYNKNKHKNKKYNKYRIYKKRKNKKYRRY